MAGLDDLTFDDLIPKRANAAAPGIVVEAPKPAQSAGHDDLSFDDLIPGANIDFNRPIEAVRADIAKIPEGPARDKAMNAWADAFVKKERETAKAGGDPLRVQEFKDMARNMARGTLPGAFADELDAGTNAALHYITGGRMGAPYDEGVAYQRATDRALDAERPVGSTVEKLIGGGLYAAPIAKRVLSGAGGMLSKVIRGGAVGGTYAGVAGFGEGEGSVGERAENALNHVPAGIVIGGALPPVAGGVGWGANKLADFATPTLARWNADARAWLRAHGINASADQRITDLTPGAEAAGHQSIANALMRGGETQASVESTMNQIDTNNRIFHNPGKAQNVTTLEDVNPVVLGRLSSSASRASPQAQAETDAFNYARQTGLTPEHPLPPGAGVPHQPMFAEPMTGAEAGKRFGQKFDTKDEDVVPKGQGERIKDMFKRAFRLEDESHHGHGANAYETEQMIMDRAQKNSGPAYKATYDAGENANITPVTQTVLTQWEREGPKLRREADATAAEVGRWVDKFKTIGNIEKFDRTKRELDVTIGNLLKENSPSTDRHLAGRLTELKNELLAKVDGIDKANPEGIGALYAKARGIWSSEMESRKHLELGADLFKEDSNVAVDAIRGVTGDENMKLVRLGYLGAMENKFERMGDTADKVTVFMNPRQRAILSQLIPRSKEKDAVFRDRPERAGRYLQDQQRMTRSARFDQGGSSSARNLEDDKTYNLGQRFVQSAGDTWERIRNSNGLMALGINGTAALVDKMFGMRGDTAIAIARQLHSADPIVRGRTWDAIAARMSPSKLEHAARLLQQYESNLTRAGARQIGGVGQGQ